MSRVFKQAVRAEPKFAWTINIKLFIFILLFGINAFHEHVVLHGDAYLKVCPLPLGYEMLSMNYIQPSLTEFCLNQALFCLLDWKGSLLFYGNESLEVDDEKIVGLS